MYYCIHILQVLNYVLLSSLINKNLQVRSNLLNLFQANRREEEDGCIVEWNVASSGCRSTQTGKMGRSQIFWHFTHLTSTANMTSSGKYYCTVNLLSDRFITNRCWYKQIFFVQASWGLKVDGTWYFPLLDYLKIHNRLIKRWLS